MGAKSFFELFSPMTVAGLVERIKPGTPRPLPPEMYAGSRTVIGNTATYQQTFGSRRNARIVAYGAPSRQSSQEKVGLQAVTLIHSREHFTVMPQDIGLGLSWGDSGGVVIPDLGQQEYVRRLTEQKQKCMNLRSSAVHLALTTGYLYYDSAGNVLPDSTGAITGIDFGVPAANKDQLEDVDGNTIIDASWGTAATDIIGQVREIKTTSIKRTGMPLTTCVYGPKLLGYFAGNTALKNLLNGNPVLANAFANNELPSGFLGIQNWIPGEGIFFIDADGDYQSLVGDDAAIFMPDPGMGWYEFLQGTCPIPTTIGGGAGTDPMAALSSMTQAPGEFAYPLVTADPAQLKTVVGDTFLPVVNQPNALFIADVTP